MLASDFTGTVAIVTGGSTGIGRATVDLLSRRGASVVFCTHDQRTLDRASADFSPQGRSVTGVQADVRSSDDMRALVETATATYGGVDILICSAGVQTYGTAEDTPEDEWRAVLDTNLTGMFLAAKYAVPRMRARGGGAIVNVSSVQGITPAGRVLGYSVSKAGIDALTRSMAVDHAPDGIRVNSLAPGPVATDLVTVSGQPGGSVSADPVSRPDGGSAGRIAHPDEIASVAAFLASKEASYMTGATVVVDGGMLASQGHVLLSS